MENALRYGVWALIAAAVVFATNGAVLASAAWVAAFVLLCAAVFWLSAL